MNHVRLLLVLRQPVIGRSDEVAGERPTTPTSLVEPLALHYEGQLFCKVPIGWRLGYCQLLYEQMVGQSDPPFRGPGADDIGSQLQLAAQLVSKLLRSPRIVEPRGVDGPL
jgi:hypothetical protein